MKVCVLFCFFTVATGHIFGDISMLNTSLYVVLTNIVLFRGQKGEILNLTPLLSKNVTIGTLSWRSMEYFNGKSHPFQTWHRCWPSKWHHATPVSKRQSSRSRNVANCLVGYFILSHHVYCYRNSCCPIYGETVWTWCIFGEKEAQRATCSSGVFAKFDHPWNKNLKS